MVEHLLNGPYANQIDINAVDNDGCNLLLLIIKNQDIFGPSKIIKEQIEYLVSKGADASKPDSLNSSVLHYMASVNAKLKVTDPEDVSDAAENRRRMTFKEYEQIVDALIKAGAKLDVKNVKESIPVDVGKNFLPKK